MRPLQKGHNDAAGTSLLAAFIIAESLISHRVPSLFGFGFGPGPTIGTKSTHKAHIYSNGRTTVDTKSEAYPDSWDTQGIYQKREFELTTMEVKAQKNQEMV